MFALISIIMSVLDARDTYKADYSQKVSDKQKIHMAAHLHDIGKIGMPDYVLLKEEKLTNEEWKIIKKHPEIGAEILCKSKHLMKLKVI